MIPYVSIIYLTKDGGQLLKTSLQAVFSQIVNFEYEVVAIDSGSKNETLSILNEFPKVRVHHVEPRSFNFGLTRDYGFAMAKGEILVAISQDAVPVGRDWLNNLITPFDDDSIAVVQGKDILPINTEVFYWDKIGLFYHTRDCKKWMKANHGIGLSFTCCAIRRVAWEENTLGSVEMSEDKVFQKMIQENGYKIFFQREAMDYHSHTYSVKSLSKRCENEGMGWRHVGIRYSLLDMIYDICKPTITVNLFKGLYYGKINRFSEFAFPIIRPLFVYKGNNFTYTYVK